jgi:sigma-B regulation protein RsbU (phosphoserine phosphatase)
METKTALESQLLQLEAANKVLQQRTEALVSLQAIGQAMITSGNLEDLAARLCRHACQMCAAERAILYYQRFEGQVQVLAVTGWEPTLVGRRVDMSLILTAQVGPQPQAFDWPPPGVPVLLENFSIQAGLAISLYAQNEWVGLMILHTSQKDLFQPGEVALLETFASQAALAIQRAGLAEQLGDKITRLEAAQVELAQKERLEREMELARQVQHSLLPRSFPDQPSFRFAARFQPARQVGGDFFDVIGFPDGRFGVAIADVTDKGMPAALYMAITRSLLRAEAHREPSPGKVLANVNGLLMELGEPNMFVTLFFGVIDPLTRLFTYVRAGHERPYLLRKGELQPLGGEGVAIGLLAGDEFHVTEQQIILSTDDKLVLYTDGLSDVLNSAEELFDRRRLESLLRSNSNREPEALCDAVFAALDRYRGDTEQFDDMTLLVVEVM